MINVLDRITTLREQKGWTEYQLSEKSGLTQSTISSWYRRDILPSLQSLEQICLAFNITISQFFDENNDGTLYINSRQKQLLDVSSKLDNIQYDALIDFLDKL